MQKSSRFILGLSLAFMVIFIAGVSLMIDIFTGVPDFARIRDKVIVPIKLANQEKSEKEMGPKTPGWVPLSQISNHLIMAVIASEDTSFFSHKGVDYHELKEAVRKDWEKKSWARGGSTITQQVVKNVYLGRQKTLWRKLKEFFWAQEMEKVLSKSEILCFYLNMAEWGPGIYGIREASGRYFSIPPALLTAKQAAFLAILVPSPIKYYAYFKNKLLTDWAKSRIEQVLRVMKKMEFIDEETYSDSLSEMLWGVASTASTEVGIENKEPAEAEIETLDLEEMKPSEEENAIKVLEEANENP